MAKVYMKVKRINEDVSITDSTLAQQYLAVKKQMADKQTRRDNLMKQVNQLDSEANILQKNLIAIEAKSAASVKSEEKEKVQPDQKVAETKPTTPETQSQQEGTNESFVPNPEFESFMEEVIASIDETYHDGEGLVYQYKPLIKKYFKKGETAEDVATMIIEMETNWNDNGIEFNKIRQAWGGDGENESYIGGDNMGKFNANMGTPTRVAESIYDDLTSSIQTELEDLEKELQKLTDIKDYIENYDNQGVKEDPEDADIDININVDGEEELPEELPVALPSPDEEDGMFMGVPETIEDYDEDKDYSNISDEIVDMEDRQDPFTPGEEEKIVDETLKAEDKAPYVPQLVEQEDIETELELMNYEDEDEPQDEYVFHIRLEPDTDDEVVAKIYKEDEDDEWTTRVVKGDEAIQDIQFDTRLNKLDIIGYLANLFGEVEEIDKKEYEYLLDDKEKIDKEYYESKVN